MKKAKSIDSKKITKEYSELELDINYGLYSLNDLKVAKEVSKELVKISKKNEIKKRMKKTFNK